MVLLSLFLAFGSSWEQRDEADWEARFGWWLGSPCLHGCYSVISFPVFGKYKLWEGAFYPPWPFYYAWIRVRSHGGCAFFDFLLGKPGRVLPGGWGEKKSWGKCPASYRETWVSGGMLVCLDCGFPETHRPSGSSAMQSGCGERGDSSSGVWLVLQQCQPVLSCLPRQPAHEGGAHPSPAKRQGSQMILRPESGEGPDRPGPCSQGSALWGRWKPRTFCFVTANLEARINIFKRSLLSHLCVVCGRGGGVCVCVCVWLQNISLHC